jgi:microcystin degradation protein MlrC
VNSKPRVAIVSIQHESNTFLGKPTTLEHFKNSVYLEGEAVRNAYGKSFHEVGGFFQGLEEAGIEAVPIFMAWTTPYGTIAAGVVEELWRTASEALKAAGKLDGVLAAPHGAGTSESKPDMDGWWLTELRKQVGAIPIVCTLDPHANVSEAMVAACDATITYRSNPHVDQRDRGLEAARLMGRILKGEVKPVQAAVFPPISINIERQLTAAEPCKLLIAKLDEVRSRPGVLAASLILGFPYADVKEMGSGFIVVANGDKGIAQRTAAELESFLLERRELFKGHLISIEKALELAASSPKPACLLDMGDNVGGGAPADGTFLMQALHKHGNLKSYGCLFDPESVKAADTAGVGNRVKMSLGGKMDRRNGIPLEVEVNVVALSDGNFKESQPRHGGKIDYQMGRTAVVQTESGLTIMLTSRRTAPDSIQQLISCGLDPKSFDVLIAKGVHGPVAAYQPVCPTLIRVNTGGVTTADMEKLDYRNRRRPMYPFEEITSTAKLPS